MSYHLIELWCELSFFFFFFFAIGHKYTLLTSSHTCHPVVFFPTTFSLSCLSFLYLINAAKNKSIFNYLQQKRRKKPTHFYTSHVLFPFSSLFCFVFLGIFWSACVLACVLGLLLVCKPLLSHVVKLGLPQASLHVPVSVVYFLPTPFLLSFNFFHPPPPLFLCTCTEPCSPSCSHLCAWLMAWAPVALGISSETPEPHLTSKGQAGPRPGKAPVARSWEQTLWSEERPTNVLGVIRWLIFGLARIYFERKYEDTHNGV